MTENRGLKSFDAEAHGCTVHVHFREKRKNETCIPQVTAFLIDAIAQPSQARQPESHNCEKEARDLRLVAG